MNFLIVKPGELRVNVEGDAVCIDVWHEDGWINAGAMMFDKITSCAKSKGSLEVWGDRGLWEICLLAEFTQNNYEVKTSVTWTYQGKKGKDPIEFFFHIPRRKGAAFFLIPGAVFHDNRHGKGDYPKGFLDGRKRLPIRADATALPMALLTDERLTCSVGIMTEAPEGSEQMSTGCAADDVWSIECIVGDHEYRMKYRYPPKENGYTDIETWTKPARHKAVVSKGVEIKQDFYFTAKLLKDTHDYANVHALFQERMLDAGSPFPDAPMAELARRRMEAVQRTYYQAPYYAGRISLDSGQPADDAETGIGCQHCGTTAALLCHAWKIGQDGQEGLAYLERIISEAQQEEGYFLQVCTLSEGGEGGWRSLAEDKISLQAQCKCLLDLLDLRDCLVDQDQDQDQEKWRMAVRRCIEYWSERVGKDGFPRFLQDGVACGEDIRHNPFMVQVLVRAAAGLDAKGYLTHAESIWQDVVCPQMIEAEAYSGVCPGVDAEDKASALAVAEAGILLYEATHTYQYLQDALKAVEAWRTYVRMTDAVSLTDAGKRSHPAGTALCSAGISALDGLVSWAPVAAAVYTSNAALFRLSLLNIKAGMAYFNNTNDLSIGRVYPCNFRDSEGGVCSDGVHARKGVQRETEAAGGGWLQDQVSGPYAFFQLHKRFGDVVVNLDGAVVFSLAKVDVRGEFEKRKFSVHFTPKTGSFPDEITLVVVSARRTSIPTSQEGAVLSQIEGRKNVYKISFDGNDLVAASAEFQWTGS